MLALIPLEVDFVIDRFLASVLAEGPELLPGGRFYFGFTSLEVNETIAAIDCDNIANRKRWSVLPRR